MSEQQLQENNQTSQEQDQQVPPQQVEETISQPIEEGGEHQNLSPDAPVEQNQQEENQPEEQEQSPPEIQEQEQQYEDENLEVQQQNQQIEEGDQLDNDQQAANLQYNFAPDQQQMQGPYDNMPHNPSGDIDLIQSQGSDGNHDMIDQLHSDYIYTEIFKAFDVDGSKTIDADDLETASKAMGWQRSQVSQLILELDPNHDGKITEDEFILIMKYIEQKQASLPPIQNAQKSTISGQAAGENQSADTLGKAQISKEERSTMSMDTSGYDLDKKKYGALLPKTGVYFLPDERIVAFLKIMNEMRKRYESVGNYMMANKFKKIFDRWSADEQQRQNHNMRIAQSRELTNIENAQRLQYQEFADAWDKYMADYEKTAFELVSQLKAKQENELIAMRNYVTQKFYNDHRWNKQIIELRKQEKIYFSIKDYVNAEKVKLICQSLEKKEVDDMQDQLTVKLTKEETTLRQKQQNQLQTLLRRIQRDREEQVKHRQVDSQRLIQRNKNLLSDILEKQATEQRRTENFLKYSLGKREEKTDEEIKDQIKTGLKTYDPKSDPLMPRLFRKFDPAKSTLVVNKKQKNTMKGSMHSMSHSVSKWDNQRSYMKGEGYGSQRTYLCINPLRKNREYAQQLKTQGFAQIPDTEKALLQLEDSYSQLTGSTKKFGPGGVGMNNLTNKVGKRNFNPQLNEGSTYNQGNTVNGASGDLDLNIDLKHNKPILPVASNQNSPPRVNLPKITTKLNQ